MPPVRRRRGRKPVHRWLALGAGVLLVAGAVAIGFARNDSPAPATPSPGPGAALLTASQPSAPLSVRLLPPDLRDATPCLQAVVSGGGKVSYRWSRNGDLLAAEDTPRLCAENFRRGDSVTLEVRTRDGRTGTTELTWPNNPPRVLEVSTDPEVFYRGVDVAIVPVGRDADNDTLTYRYQWLINDDANPVDTDAVLAGDRFQKGDRVAVEVIANDGLEDGLRFRSSDAVVPDAPPRFVSEPPGELSFPEFSYQLQAEDPDGDPFSYELLQAPDGMLLDAHRGLLRWQIPAGQVGSFPVEIRVQDSDGASSVQSFTLTLALN